MSGLVIESIERFAELCAVLDDGFTERASALSAAGLDEAAWESIQAHWTRQVRDDAGDTMAGRFGAAYAARRRALMHGMPGARIVAPSAVPLRGLDVSAARPTHTARPALSFVPEVARGRQAF